ncbi:MAG: hypothetical protein K0U41_06705 [Gammaproteobacteria bacterium]|nr:hypothetical protein [Gammaproteobacteria bacterium]
MTYIKAKLNKNLIGSGYQSGVPVRGMIPTMTQNATNSTGIPYFGTAIDVHTEPSSDKPLHPLLGKLNNNLEMAQIHMKEISDELYESRERIEYLEDLLKKFNLLTNKTDTTDVVDD